ncbi:hypothetical protein ACET3X_005245 [Alternaria dauci]|uniref:Uncharacterized protein n=1 Tax=Alternaria dauci TaxID=48095 RepID=A0ABR3UK35_9PLEO
MSLIVDTQARQAPLSLTPTQVKAEVQESDNQLTQANCSCTTASTDLPRHACTAASYIPPNVEAPPTDHAGRNIDLTYMGSQFDGH